MFVRPRCVVGFRDNAGEFAEDVGALREFSEIVGPGLVFASADGRFGDVVEDEDLVGVAIDEADGRGQLVVDDEDVVGEIEDAEMEDAVVEGDAIEVRVGFGLEDVTDAFEGRAAGEFLEQRRAAGIGERDPAYDSGDEGVGGSHFKEPCGFDEGLASLNGDDGVDLGGPDLFGEVGREKVTANGGHGVVDPAIFGGRVVPDVMVRVDARIRHSNAAFAIGRYSICAGA